MSQSTVLWFGPVNLSQVHGATVPGARALALPCTGDGNPSCGQTGDSLEDANGRRLPALLRREGIDEDGPGDLFLGAFSAGGSMVKRLLLHEADRARVRAVVLADATYTDWASPGVPLAPEGFVLFCLDALSDRKLFVATASSAPNKSLPSGSQTLSAIRAEVERRSGKKFAPHTLPAGVEPDPVEAWRIGNVILADYKTKVAHGAHATRLAAPIWQTILLPWLAESEGMPEEPVPPASAPTLLVMAVYELMHHGEVLSCRRSWNHAGIRAIQEALVHVGIEVVVDGHFGPQTHAAVRTFQAWAGLGVDGAVGPKTFAAIGHALESGTRVCP